jgi:hypothetical protein
MAIKKIIPFMALVLLLASCGSTKVSVTVLRAPQVELSVPVEQVAVVNRVNLTASTKQFVNGHIIAQFNGVTPIMVNQATQVFSQTLRSAYYIQSIDTTYETLPANQNFNRSLPDIQTYTAACKALDVDVIVTVDGYDANVDSDSEVRWSTPVDRTYGTVQIPYFEGQQNVEMRMLFRVYSCADSAVFEQELDISTQKSRVTSSSNYVEISGKQRQSASILIEAAKQVGSNLVDYLAPNYETESRRLYAKGNDQMEQAFKYAQQNNWKAAADIWYLQATSGNKKIASWATFNLITANEMLGNYTEAISLAELCVEKYGMKQAEGLLQNVQWRQSEMQYLAKIYPRTVVQ